jgi:hypothetical protein
MATRKQLAALAKGRKKRASKLRGARIAKKLRAKRAARNKGK